MHKTYNLGVGVELFKRPGLTAFLYKMSQNYEVVIFGNGDSGEINETAESLDPTEMIMKRGGQMQIQRPCFGHEQLLLKDGEYIKDLSYVNRPIKDIVYLDFSDDLLKYHKDNAIIIPKFDGDVEDRALTDVLPFLMCK